MTIETTTSTEAPVISGSFRDSRPTSRGRALSTERASVEDMRTLLKTMNDAIAAVKEENASLKNLLAAADSNAEKTQLVNATLVKILQTENGDLRSQVQRLTSNLLAEQQRNQQALDNAAAAQATANEAYNIAAVNFAAQGSLVNDWVNNN